MTQKQFLIAMSGVVGSGKTHIAKILEKKLPAVRLTTDETRVHLRENEKSMSLAPSIERKKRSQLLQSEQSVIADFDAVNPERLEELSNLAKEYHADFYIIEVVTPEPLILARLREKRYTPSDLFRNAEEAIRAYRLRKGIRKRFQEVRSSAERQSFTTNVSRRFTVDNSKPLEPQIDTIIKEITRK